MAQARNTNVISAFPTRRHNHGRCVSTAIESAERVSEARGARFTAIRRRVLELVWASHEPVAAYELLDRLKLEKSNATPPTIYRALEFLLENGLIHRIESLNAYVGCGNPENEHNGQFLICTRCGVVAELGCDSIDGAVRERAGELGFTVESHTVEIQGICESCGKTTR